VVKRHVFVIPQTHHPNAFTRHFSAASSSRPRSTTSILQLSQLAMSSCGILASFSNTPAGKARGWTVPPRGLWRMAPSRRGVAALRREGAAPLGARTPVRAEAETVKADMVTGVVFAIEGSATSRNRKLAVSTSKRRSESKSAVFGKKNPIFGRSDIFIFWIFGNSIRLKFCVTITTSLPALPRRARRCHLTPPPVTPPTPPKSPRSTPRPADMEFNVTMGLDFQRGDIANKKTNVGFASAKNEKVGLN